MMKKIKDNIIMNNPVMVQSFALIPILSLTKDLKQALVMGLAVIFVMLSSNLFVSIFKKIIHENVEYIAYMTIISAFSTISVLFIEKYFPTIALNMGIYLPLIAVNTLILHRVRTYAIFQNVSNSIIDAITNGFGFLFIMLDVAVVRELLGKGSIFDTQIIPTKFTLPIVSTPAFAFIILGLYFGFFNWYVRHQKLKGVR